MSTHHEVRWILTFGHPRGGSHSEIDFPDFDFWHADKESSMAEGKRVLKELALRDDKRAWYAAGYPDPFLVGSGQHPGDSWFISKSELT